MDKRRRTSEWARCSEGFSDFKSFGKESGAVRSRKNVGSDKLTSRSRLVYNTVSDIVSQDITWSSSDSEDGTVTEIQLGKRKKVMKRLSPSKKKSQQVSHLPSSSETLEIVASDSDSENISQETAKNSGSLQGQEGSIQGYESTSEIDEEHVPSAEYLPQTALSTDLTESPSISSSTQSVSPSATTTGSGVKASDWVKSLQLKTPSKSENQGETTTAEDSAKKKKKHSRGGLAEHLGRLQAREKSAVRIWSHQQNKSFSASQDSAKSIALRVLGFEVLYSMQIVKCAVLLNQEEREHKLVLFPVSQTEQLNLQVGTEVTVYPPWQQLEMNDGQSVMLCTRFCQVTFQPEEDAPREGCSLSPSRKNTVSATWNCPCVQGLCRFPTLCPAYKFPSVPGFLLAKSTAASNDQDLTSRKEVRVISPEKHLHTVVKKSKNVTNVSDSLLKSIERSSEHTNNLNMGSSSISFMGTVHRVNTLGKDDKSVLLVEDGHGTVCEIQVTHSTLQEAGLSEGTMEGKSFQFSGLHIQCRKTRDKDMPLFSLIDSVWSRTRAIFNSQESGCSTQESKQPSVSEESPSFCYTLICDENENVLIRPSSVSVVQTRPTAYTELNELMMDDSTLRRYSCLARLLYVFQSTNSEHTPAGPVLFITDTSLLKTTKPYFQCQFRSDYYNCQTLFQEKGGQVLELKDVLLEQGHLLVDSYTKVLFPGENEANCGKTLKIKDLKLPTICATVKDLELCTVSGIISEVDEDAAYSWEACNYCSSDQLISQPTETGDSSSLVKCKSCQKIVTNPDTKMKMEIMVKCDQISDIAVRLDLRQTTIEKLLPNNEEPDEGYELSSVLNKLVGPLNCIVIGTNRNKVKELSLREIDLLL